MLKAIFPLIIQGVNLDGGTRPPYNLSTEYIVLHPLFSTNAFLIKLFENFEEQGEDFFTVISDSLVLKILGYAA